MAIKPTTDLFLLKCPLTLNNKHQITFSNKNTQYNYFSSLPKLEIDNISYQRRDSVIRFPAHIDTLINYNYCMYQNENYSNKWFYAFIVNMTYINDNMTEITIATDTFQTWQFDLIYKESFIEREMISVSEDIAGANLIPEGLETGEYKVGGTADIDGLKPYYIVAYSRNPKEDGLTNVTPAGQGMIVNGVANGLYYCICNNETIQGLLQSINNRGYGESIVAIFSVPALALVGFNGWTLQDLNSDDPLLWWMVNNFKANPLTINMITRPSSLDGYTPRNRKLLTYPYIYLGFNPINGSEKLYRYENFSNNTPIFKAISEINPNPSICFIPQNYRGKTGDNLSDVAILNGFPQIGWVTDYFNNWIAQNGNIISLQMEQEAYNYKVDAIKTGINGSSDIVANSLSLNPIGATKAGANLGLDLASLDKNHEFYVKQQMAQIEKQQMLPNNSSLGTSATLLGYNLIDNNIFTRYNIKRQFAERIDKYFDMYGYQTNKIKTPNLNNRPNWNYIKMQGANILGNIPQQDLQQIKEFFNNGITLWHNTENYLDYSVNNR